MGTMPRPRAAPLTTLFGRRLRALRTMRKLTQEELGERAGVTAKFIGMVERGDGNPSLLVLGRLGTALDVGLPDLVRLEETRPEGSPDNAARGLAASEQITEYLSGRPAADLQRALRVLEAALGAVGPPRGSGSGAAGR
jgi:transcriptional regulator with XRE-family HTH domain